jgi:hypothetical protein
MRLPVMLLSFLVLAAGPRLFAGDEPVPGAVPAAQASPVSSAMRPGRQISLSKVKDTFFSYVLGIVLTGIDVNIDNAQMRDILTEFQSKLKFPFDLVTRVVQRNDPDDEHRVISLIFNGNVVIPIPFSFLGYHPGTLRSTERLNFRVIRTAYTDPQEPGVYTPVYDLTLADGKVLIDIDDWLVYLLSNVLDKLEVRHIVFFNYRGAWIGLVEGEGKVFKRDMREYFDFTNNKIIYPIPEKLDAMGRAFIHASPALPER